MINRYSISIGQLDRSFIYAFNEQRYSLEVLGVYHLPALAVYDDPVSAAASPILLFSRSTTLSQPWLRARCYRQVRLCTRVISWGWKLARLHPRCNFPPGAPSRSESESRIPFEFITRDDKYEKRELELIFSINYFVSSQFFILIDLSRCVSWN